MPTAQLAVRALTIAEVCKMLWVGQTTFHVHIKKEPGFPTAIKVQPGIVRYIDTEVEAWLLTRERAS